MAPHGRLLELVHRRRPLVHAAAVIAHRGASCAAPENTMASFRRAVEAGADIVEFDLQVTADGHVVVHHDAKLGRCVLGRGRIRDLGLAAIRALDAGRRFAAEFEGERVPTLDEALEFLLARDVVPMMEIKGRFKSVVGIEERLADTFKNHGGAADRVVVIVHDRLVQQAVRTTCDGALVSLLTFRKKSSRLAADIGFDGVVPYWKSLSLRLVAELHARDLFLTPWTVNRRKDMERLLRLSVDAIITDDPALLRTVLEEDAAAQEARAALTAVPPDGTNVSDLDLEALDSDGTGDPSPDEERLLWLRDSGEWLDEIEPPEGEED